MKLFKIKTFFIFFLFQNSYGFAQQKIELHLVDNAGKLIPYASVFWSKNLGLVCDAFGYLQIPDKTKIDSLIITAIGYERTVVKKNAFSDNANLTIKLQKSFVELPEIIIAKYTTEEEYGSTDTKQRNSYIKNDLCINLQTALLIKSYNYPAQCKSISVFIAKQSSTDIPYRLRLYDIGADSLPGKDLLLENIIVNSYKPNSWNTYSFDTLTVQLPKNGFFVAVEWLCKDIKSENGLCIAQTNTIEEDLTYYKYTATAWWQPKFKYTKGKSQNIMLKTKIASVK
jgi:hypothetical protein